MPPVIFIGIGLNDERGISLEGLDEARKAGKVFAEFYTNLMPNLKLASLEALVRKKIVVLTRKQLEDEEGREVLVAAENEKVAFLVPGDPMIATTHVSIRLALAKKGIESRIIHGASVMSAVCGATGLQSYKFGKSTTLPRDRPAPPSVLDVIGENRGRSLHTSLLLEINIDGKAQLTIQDALDKLIDARPEIRGWLAVGAARLGSPDQLVKASRATTLKRVDFGSVPHSLVFPGKLHFMEAEALKAFAGATDPDLEGSL